MEILKMPGPLGYLQRKATGMKDSRPRKKTEFPQAEELAVWVGLSKPF